MLIKTKEIELETVSINRAQEIKCPSCGQQLNWSYDGMSGNATCCHAYFKMESIAVVFSVHEPIEDFP